MVELVLVVLGLLQLSSAFAHVDLKAAAVSVSLLRLSAAMMLLLLLFTFNVCFRKFPGGFGGLAAILGHHLTKSQT